ncbi:MAG: autotransporter, partial [Moraxellaceae bacterium]
RWFPGISIQGKGLLATEGVISVPINDTTATSENPYGRCAIAVNSHFLEFIDLENPSETPLLAHQLKTGAYYSPILSTGGGLYRYHLKDTIKCTGTHGHTPIIRFEGKLDRVSDVCGEKIHAQQVEIGLRKACIDLDVKHDFMMLSPSLLSAPPSYCLYIDSESSDNTLTQLAKQLDRYLCKGHHYKLCQDLNQLAPICVKRVSDGWQKYQRALIASGQRMGDIKPTFLEYRHDWSLIFD